MFHEIGPRKLNISYENRIPNEDDYVLFIKDFKIMIHRGEALELPTVEELSSFSAKTGDTQTEFNMIIQPDMKANNEEFRFLFRIDDKAFFLALTEPENAAEKYIEEKKPEEKKPEDEYIFVTPRELRRAKPMWLAYAATLGFRISEFYRLNAFCGKCGAKNIHSETERAMRCPECGSTVYPPIAPSVIVLIRNGQKTVLTKYQASHSEYRQYALVAGYVESGETPEEAVEREVFEEVGLKVKNITYYKSQPWPISGALLLGFTCDLDGDDTIVRQEDELAVAEWVDRMEIPDRSADVSLTSEMMEMFRTGRL